MIPDPTPLTREQERFLALHHRHLVTKWEWLFRGATLRAEAERGLIATISAVGFTRLVNAGLVEQLGVAGVRLTDEGRAAA